MLKYYWNRIYYMYEIYETATFNKEKRKIMSKSELQQYQHELENLKVNPYKGDPLGRKYFRELKFKGKRLYFLIYDDLVLVLFVAISKKKEQQQTINTIKKFLPMYYELAKDYAKQRA